MTESPNIVKNVSETKPKCIFFDKPMSNNAARTRLWIRLKRISQDLIETKWVELEDLQSAEYAKVNPLRKIPALTTDTGMHLFESNVILDYIEDRYGDEANAGLPPFVGTSPEDRAFCNLLIRIHDIYISSPNCTQPNFSHTQGCMYLTPIPTDHCPARRTMDAPTRAAKVAEIYKQLCWLEETIHQTPYMCGSLLTKADITWFPTCIFFEFLLPTVFGWIKIFHESTHFPKLTKWFATCMENPHFSLTRKEILDQLELKHSKNQFLSIIEDVAKHPELVWVFTDTRTQRPVMT